MRVAGDKRFVVVRERVSEKFFEHNVTVAIQPPEVFLKKSYPENLINFTGKCLFWSLYLINLDA